MEFTKMCEHGSKIRRGAFTLIELLVVIAIIALLVSILLPALASARKAGRQAVCMSNMNQLGLAHHMYQEDFKGYLAALNGRAQDKTGRMYFPWLVDLETQAQELITRSTGRTDIPTFNDVSPQSDTTVVCEQYSSLVLVDYMGEKMPIPGVVCPEDAPRLSWRANPMGMTTAAYKPTKPRNADGRNLRWWPFSSSYQLMPTAWAPDGPPGTRTSAPGYNRRETVLGQAGTHDKYAPHHKPIWSTRKREEITYPSGKVAVADSQQRHDGKTDLYFAYPQAKQPLLFWDASVSVRRTGEANFGWDPKDSNTPANPTTPQLSFQYDPDPAFESPIPSTGKTETAEAIVTGYYKWTRSGLRGIDYGGAEISTKGW